MKLTDLKKQLNTMDQKELVALICKLYKGDKQAQSIIDIELCGASVEAQLAAECKRKYVQPSSAASYHSKAQEPLSAISRKPQKARRISLI